MSLNSFCIDALFKVSISITTSTRRFKDSTFTMLNFIVLKVSYNIKQMSNSQLVHYFSRKSTNVNGSQNEIGYFIIRNRHSNHLS